MFRNLDIEIIEPDKEHDEIPNNIIFDEKIENLKKEVPNNSNQSNSSSENPF